MFKIEEVYKSNEWKFSLGIKTAGDNNSQKFNTINIGFWKHTIIIRVPEFIKPKLKYVDTTYLTHLANKTTGYYESIGKNYGFAFYNDSLHIHYGIQPGVWGGADKENSNHTKVFFNGWADTRRIRYEFFNPDWTHFAHAPDKINGALDFDAIRKCEADVPKVLIRFNDFDGEEITATCHLYEMEWEYGKGLFKWVKYFRKNIVVRRVELSFDKEVGEKKGSWKGGTLGHSCDVNPGEGLFAAFSRYGEKYNFSNLRVVR